MTEILAMSGMSPAELFGLVFIVLLVGVAAWAGLQDFGKRW